MAASLEHVNATNAKSTTLALRVLEPSYRQIENKDMEIFQCRLVSSSGNYTCGEATIFGEKQLRTKIKKALDKNYEHDKVYKFSKLTLKKKNNQFTSSPHEYIVNMTDKQLKATKLTGADDEAIPKEAEPPMNSSDLLELACSQLVDTHAVVAKVDEVTEKKGKKLRKAHLYDASGKYIELNFWEEMVPCAASLTTNKPVYFYSVYLVVTDKGTKHLTFKKTSKFVEASGNCALANALKSFDIDTIRDDQRECISTIASGDWDKQPAVSSNLAALEFATFFKKELPDSLFEVSGCLVSLQETDAENLLTRCGTRIYTKVSVSDYSTTLEANLTEKPALTITGTSTKEEFTEDATSGFLAFERATLRFRWARSKTDDKLKLSIVEALPKLFDEPEEHKVPPTDSRLLPVQLQWISNSPSGKIAVTYPGQVKKLLTTGILALVIGVQEPKTEVVDNGFAIKNFVQETWGDASQVLWKATTTAVTARLTKYALSKKEKALVHVTHVNAESKEITIADMWRLMSSHDEKEFEKEVMTTAGILSNPPHTLKRKIDHFDNTLQGLMEPCNKRVHLALGESATPA